MSRGWWPAGGTDPGHGPLSGVTTRDRGPGVGQTQHDAHEELPHGQAELREWPARGEPPGPSIKLRIEMVLDRQPRADADRARHWVGSAPANRAYRSGSGHPADDLRKVAPFMAQAVKLLLVALLVAGSAMAAARAEPFREGQVAFVHGDYATAFRLWRPLAEQGAPDAQFELGLLYLNGQGVAQDDAAAMMWFRKAADQGLATAQIRLGVMYESGQGVPKDYGQAVHWYRMAADQGRSSAQFSMASAYGTGRGVPQDYVQAYKWWSLATKFFPGRETMHMPRSANGVDSIDQAMTPEQIAEARRLVAEWKPVTGGSCGLYRCRDGGAEAPTPALKP
jgi:hypothetical protein